MFISLWNTSLRKFCRKIYSVCYNMNSKLINFRVLELSSREEGEVMVSERQMFSVHFSTVVRAAVSTFLYTSGVFTCY
jgi:hypothetical protein